MPSNTFRCANSRCRTELDRDYVTLITTVHVRRFCSVECIAEGQSAHYDELAHAAGLRLPCHGSGEDHNCSPRGYYTLIDPRGEKRYFCDSECLRERLKTDWEEVLTGLDKEMKEMAWLENPRAR